MIDQTIPNRDTSLDAFAAELALAAYSVALHTRAHGTWLDLELSIWRTLADKLTTRSKQGQLAADW
jgi:hypothetical protein